MLQTIQNNIAELFCRLQSESEDSNLEDSNTGRCWRTLLEDGNLEDAVGGRCRRTVTQDAVGGR